MKTHCRALPGGLSIRPAMLLRQVPVLEAKEALGRQDGMGRSQRRRENGVCSEGGGVPE